MKGIKDFNDLSRIQGQVLVAFPRIADSLVRDFLRDKQVTNAGVAALNRAPMVSVLELGARIVPLQRSSREVISGYNTLRAEQRLPPLDPAKNGTDADYLSVAFYKQLEYEKSVYEPYIAEQRRSNQVLLNQSLNSLNLATQQMSQMALENQQIGVIESTKATSVTSAGRNLRRATSLGGELNGTLQLLNSLDAATPQEYAAKDLAQKALDASAEAYQQGDSSLGKELGNLAMSIADIGLGFVPIVGQGRDLYESYFGRSLLTDRELSSTERSLAFAGVLTFGFISTSTKIEAALMKLVGKGEVLSKIAASALETVRALKPLDLLNLESLDALRRAFRRGIFGDTEAVIKDINRNILERSEAMGIKLVDRKIGFADDLNIKYLSKHRGHQAPHRPDTLYIKGKTSSTLQTHVRVFRRDGDASNIIRPWVVDKRFITSSNGEYLPANKIKEILNLPSLPTDVVNLTIPKDTSLALSEIAVNQFGKQEGAIQTVLYADHDTKLTSMFDMNSIRNLKK